MRRSILALGFLLAACASPPVPQTSSTLVSADAATSLAEECQWTFDGVDKGKSAELTAVSAAGSHTVVCKRAGGTSAVRIAC